MTAFNANISDFVQLEKNSTNVLVFFKLIWT